MMCMCVFIGLISTIFRLSSVEVALHKKQANKQKLIYYLAHLTRIPKPVNTVAHFHFDYTFIKSVLFCLFLH